MASATGTIVVADGHEGNLSDGAVRARCGSVPTSLRLRKNTRFPALIIRQAQRLGQGLLFVMRRAMEAVMVRVFGNPGFVVGAGMALTLVMGGGASAGEADEIAAIRAATAKYQDVAVALAAGYVRSASGCVDAELEGMPAELGAMGVHYIHRGKLEITTTEPRVDGTSTYTDFLDPAILIYEPQADGSLVLVAIENLVFQKSWKDAGHAEPPQFQGRTWDNMQDDPATPHDEAHGFQPHFDQHVWLYRENPNGNLMPFNPAVSCRHAEKTPGHSTH